MRVFLGADTTESQKAAGALPAAVVPTVTFLNTIGATSAASGITALFYAAGSVTPLGWAFAACAAYAALPKTDLGVLFGLKPAGQPITRDDVNNWYVTYLGYPGDPAGIDYWLANAQGKGYDWGLSDFLGQVYATKVDYWYLSLLSRQSDPSGREYWTSRCQIVGYDTAYSEFLTATKDNRDQIALAKTKMKTAGVVSAAAIAAALLL